MKLATALCPHKDRLLRLELRQLEAGVLRGQARAALARALRPALRHRRGEQHLLSLAEPRRRRELGAHGSARLPVHDQVSPLRDAHQAADRSRPGLAASTSGSSRCSRRRRWGRSSGSSRRTSSATTTGCGRARALPERAAPLHRVPPPELVRRRDVRAAARARRRARDRRPARGEVVPDARLHDATGRSSASTTARGAGAATTASRELRGVGSEFGSGAARSTSSPTSTTTGRSSPCGTRCG